MTASPARSVFFLDANVLISAAWKEDAEVAGIWKLDRVQLVTSSYVMAEVRRNLPKDAQLERLGKLMREVLLPDLPTQLDADSAEILLLPEKDRPVMRDAIATGPTTWSQEISGTLDHSLDKPSSRSLSYRQPNCSPCFV